MVRATEYLTWTFVGRLAHGGRKLARSAVAVEDTPALVALFVRKQWVASGSRRESDIGSGVRSHHVAAERVGGGSKARFCSRSTREPGRVGQASDSNMVLQSAAIREQRSSVDRAGQHC